MPGIDPGIHPLRKKHFRKKIGCRIIQRETRGASHRAALCADPLALSSGDGVLTALRNHGDSAFDWIGEEQQHE
jgi:hypothetical protein